MRRFFALALIFGMTCLAVADEPRAGPGTWLPPSPRIDAEECFPVPKLNLKELLLQLGAERDGLGTDHDAIRREFAQGLEGSAADTAMLRLRVKTLLAKLKQQSAASAAPAPHGPGSREGHAPDKTAPKPPEKLPVLVPKIESSSGNPALPSVDPMALGRALFKAGNYDGALRAFRMVELKGTRAEQRAPVQYLIACCLRHVGKADEAANLLREVANSKGDEQVAACAQWQLAAQRWHKDTQDRLVQIRQRRVALEKQP